MNRTLALEQQYCAHNYAPLPVVLVRGEGAYVWVVEGRRNLDMMSAYSAVSHGHCQPRLVRALTEQATRRHSRPRSRPTPQPSWWSRYRARAASSFRRRAISPSARAFAKDTAFCCCATRYRPAWDAPAPYSRAATKACDPTASCWARRSAADCYQYQLFLHGVSSWRSFIRATTAAPSAAIRSPPPSGWRRSM